MSDNLTLLPLPAESRHDFFRRGPLHTAALLFLVFAAATMTADAQFRETGPPPLSEAAARQQIRTLLESVNPGNRSQTIKTISGLVVWYRDLIDDELIDAWRKDSRANLPEVIESLADSQVATAVVRYSWREHRPEAFQPSYAPMLGQLMLRYPASARPFMEDLTVGSGADQQPALSPPEAETVCRILIDMPDIGTWKQSALRILPEYRAEAEKLLRQDIRGDDQERSYRAQLWLADLKFKPPAVASEPRSPRARPSVALSSTTVLPSTQTATAELAPAPTKPPLEAHSVAGIAPQPTAERSGNLECTGGPIPQNAEYIFRNIPMQKMRLDYDTKVWEARLAPGDGGTQKVILRNKSSGPQNHCVVRWRVIP